MAWYDALVDKKMKEKLARDKKYPPKTKREATLSRKGKCPEYEDSPVMKSSWERNVFRFLHYMHWAHIKYEPMTFKFETPYRKALDYKPDFFAVHPEDYKKGTSTYRRPEDDPSTTPPRVDNGQLKIIEVKGRLDGKSKTKLRGFRKHYPDLIKQMIIITESRNFDWVRQNLPEAAIMDYYHLKRNIGSMVGFE